MAGGLGRSRGPHRSNHGPLLRDPARSMPATAASHRRSRGKGVAGQVMFDSHVVRLLDASVALVNALTDGSARGRPYTAPRGAESAPAIVAALPPAGTDPDAIGPAQADHLIATAWRMREIFEAVDAGDLDAAAATLNVLLRAAGADRSWTGWPGNRGNCTSTAATTPSRWAGAPGARPPWRWPSAATWPAGWASARRRAATGCTWTDRGTRRSSSARRRVRTGSRPPHSGPGAGAAGAEAEGVQLPLARRAMVTVAGRASVNRRLGRSPNYCCRENTEALLGNQKALRGVHADLPITQAARPAKAVDPTTPGRTPPPTRRRAVPALRHDPNPHRSAAVAVPRRRSRPSTQPQSVQRPARAPGHPHQSRPHRSPHRPRHRATRTGTGRPPRHSHPYGAEARHAPRWRLWRAE